MSPVCPAQRPGEALRAGQATTLSTLMSPAVPWTFVMRGTMTTIPGPLPCGRAAPVACASARNYVAPYPRCLAVASRRGCQGQPNAPGASPGLRRPSGEPSPLPPVPSAEWPVRPNAGVYLPADMPWQAPSRACVRVPPMAGILPSLLVISPLARSGSQGQRESLLLSRQPRASQSNDLCVNLWTISINAQINHCIAVDTRRCGKVDNRTAQSCQAAAFRCPQGTAVLPLPASRLHQDSDRRRQVTGRQGGAARWRRPVTTQLTRGVGKPRRAAPAQLSAR